VSSLAAMAYRARWRRVRNFMRRRRPLDAMNLLDGKYFQYQCTERGPLDTCTIGRRHMPNAHFQF